MAINLGTDRRTTSVGDTNCESSNISRQLGLTQMIRVITNSSKLWQDNALGYEDALQQTWLYFCQNLCEIATCNKCDHSRGSVITWLNAHLQQRLKDGCIQQQSELLNNTNQILKAKEVIGSNLLLATLRQWVETDLDGELRRIHLQGHPEVTCQVLILQRLPPETSWKTISAKFNIDVLLLLSFYRQQCLPRLRQLGASNFLAQRFLSVK